MRLVIPSMVFNRVFVWQYNYEIDFYPSNHVLFTTSNWIKMKIKVVLFIKGQ